MVRLSTVAWFLLPTAVAVLAFGVAFGFEPCVVYGEEVCEQVWKEIAGARYL